MISPIGEKVERPVSVDAAPIPCKEHDPVNHPSHYTYGTIETIDYIEDKG